MIAFLIWILNSAIFIGIGVLTRFSKKPSGFWANAKTFEVNNIRNYNRAMSRLWSVFGLLMIPLGFPLLYGQNSALIIITMLGLFAEIIGLMIIYTCVIEKKYRK